MTQAEILRLLQSNTMLNDLLVDDEDIRPPRMGEEEIVDMSSGEWRTYQARQAQQLFAALTIRPEDLLHGEALREVMRREIESLFGLEALHPEPPQHLTGTEIAMRIRAAEERLSVRRLTPDNIERFDSRRFEPKRFHRGQRYRLSDKIIPTEVRGHGIVRDVWTRRDIGLFMAVVKSCDDPLPFVMPIHPSS